jgi:alanine racemase
MASAGASWIEVSAAALRGNVDTFREVLRGADVGLGVVLKADAYGHGLSLVYEALAGRVDRVHVIEPADALAIRALEEERGLARTPVLVLGVVGPEEAVALARAGCAAVVGDEGARAWGPALRAAEVQLSVHVHVDSGLSREGWPAESLGDVAAWVGAEPSFRWEGLLTHFADTEDVTDQTFARRQLDAFAEAVGVCEAVAGRRLLRHAAASAAALVLADSRLDEVRVGISLYGVWASDLTRLSAAALFPEPPRLKPALTWRVRPQLVKWLPAGAYVGYGCTHRCRDATRIAVLPVGYFDGYPRALSGKAHVLIGGRRCPVLGRVMMNHVIVDVTGVQADGPWVATLLGVDGEEEVNADRLAAWASTIAYEVVARLGAHLPRHRVDP